MNTFKKWLRLCSWAPVLAVAVNLCSAHDNAYVHPLITKYAFEAWASTTAGGGVLSDWSINNTSAYTFNGEARKVNAWDGSSQFGWINKGAIFEDTDDGGGEARCLNHFYDPLASEPALNDPAGVHALTGNRDSFTWATDGAGKTGPNNYTWAVAREKAQEALTAGTQAQRDAALGNAFFVLGKVMHLNQDLSQPEHSRNDAHCINGEGVFGLWGLLPKWRWIENFGQDVCKNINDPKNSGLKTKLATTTPLDWNASGFVRLKDFWDRDLYSAANSSALDADASSTTLLGLAEFSNGNFLGADATYFDFHPSGKTYPYPRIASTTYAQSPELIPLISLTQVKPLEMQNGSSQKYGLFLEKVKHGIQVQRHSMMLYSKFTETIRRPPVFAQSSTVDSTAPSFTIQSIDVLREYHEILLPKAASYSAGMISYFFRGKIEAQSATNNSGVAEISVTNRSGQALKGGNFNVYYDTSAGVRSIIQGVLAYGPTGALWMADSKLEDGETVTVTYTPYAGITTSGRIVYKGTGGIDPATLQPLDPVDAGKLVATKPLTLTTAIPGAPTVESRAVSAVRTRRGFDEFAFGEPSSPKIIYRKSVRHYRDDMTLGPGTYYSTSTWWGTCTKVDFFHEGYAEATDSTEYPIDDVAFPIVINAPSPHGTVTYDYTMTVQPDGEPEVTQDTQNTSFGGSNFWKYPLNQATPTSKTQRSGSLKDDAGGIAGANGCGSNNTGTVVYKNDHTHSGDETLSLPYTLAELKTNTANSMSSFQGNWYSGFVQASSDLSADERTCTMQRAQYRIRIPLVSGAQGEYKVSWVERFIPKAGSGITSIEVRASGRGYTSPPIVSISLPGGSGVAATATANLNASGGVESITITNAGSGYKQAPTVSIASPGGSGITALVAVHLGAETPKTYTWSGATPGGYSSSDSTTWPVSPEYPLNEPEASGVMTLGNMKVAFTPSGP